MRPSKSKEEPLFKELHPLEWAVLWAEKLAHLKSKVGRLPNTPLKESLLAAIELEQSRKYSKRGDLNKLAEDILVICKKNQMASANGVSYAGQKEVIKLLHAYFDNLSLTSLGIVA